MRYLITLLFLATSSLFSQEITIRGVVVDKETNKQIPYVNLSILDKEGGTSSNEDGLYTLKVLRDVLDSDLSITSLGYRDTIISIKKMVSIDTVFLTPKTEWLNEVLVSTAPKNLEELIVNPLFKKKSKGGFRGGKSPYIVAMFFPHKEIYDSFNHLKNVNFQLYRHEESSARVRIYRRGTDGLPSEDVLKESVIVDIKKGQRDVTVDVSEYDIQIPREGFYIAFEWLYIPKNEYVEVYKSKNGLGKKGKREELLFAPSLGTIMKNKGTFEAAEFYKGAWRFLGEMDDKNPKTGAPAIGFTLSN
ncbi:carboxypeptidase-like regulatory domain-containing protein [Dokdonia ponticola]|uniref:Carboxypeptidase-like regulatory domain-containing protein n=1 Tax=Dokdonia ponticola TaxID=2041041 RepID=A0ABV9HSY5_9FLAO